jgi:hypothetical protein
MRGKHTASYSIQNINIQIQMNKKRWMTALLLGALLGARPRGEAPRDYLESGFIDPPIEARPRALWCWVNGNVNLSSITHELEEAKAKGMGGFDIWDVGIRVDPNNIVPAGPPFMGPESVQAIGHAVREAERVGLDLGLTIASSWNAGGDWVRPEHGVMALFRENIVVEGPASVDRVLPFPKLPAEYERHPTLIDYDMRGLPTFYREVAVLAFPLRADSTIRSGEIVDLSARVDRQGRLRWRAPRGRWQVARYVCAPTGQPLMVPSPNSNGRMVDHFSAEATRVHLDVFFTRLNEELGSLRDRALKYFYTDSYEANTAAWTPAMPEEFRRRRGYDLRGFLPILDGFSIDGEDTSERFRFDFKKTLSDLIVENHYALSTALCVEQGLGFHAEAGGPGPPIHNVPFEDLRALGALSAPRGEFWNKHPQLDLLQIIKGIASASHVYNQKYVEAESFTSVWLWQEGPAELKPLADRAFCEGLNRIYYHTWPHRVPEGGDPGYIYNFGTIVNTSLAWWPKSRAFHDYLGRVSFLLQQGNFVGDVAYYYGDQAPNFVPHKRVDPSLGFGFDYDVVNSEAILNLFDTRDGKLVLPHGQTYEILVLPHQEAISPEVLEKLADLARRGATIVGPRPRRAHSLHNRAANDQRVATLAEQMWGPCDSVNVRENTYGLGKVAWGKSLRQTLAERGVGPDLALEGYGEQPDADFIHRRAGDADIYFLWNRAERPAKWLATFRARGKWPQIWNPDKGTIAKNVVYEENEEGIRLPLALPAHGALFVVFRDGKPPRAYRQMTHERQPVFPEYEGEAILINAPGRYEWIDHNGHAASMSVEAPPSPLAIDGPFELRFPFGWDAPPSVVMAELTPWNESPDEGVRYYSGVATYQKKFTLAQMPAKNQRALLDLGEVREVAEVYLNGRPLGIRCWPPYRFDVSEAIRPGENFLVVEVANVLSNRLSGDGKRPEGQKRTRSNVIKGPNAWMRPWAEVPLHRSGLMGPVRLRFVHEISPIE